MTGEQMTAAPGSPHVRQAYHSLTPMLGVADVARSRAFYVGMLGFDCLSDYAPEGTLCWCDLQCGDANLMLTLNPKAGPAGQTTQLYVRVADAASLHAALKARGVKVTDLADRFYQMREFETTDPDGHVIIFGQDISGGHACCCGHEGCHG